MREDLHRIPIPGESEAERRAWEVIARAFVEREPSPAPPRRRPLIPALAAAAAAAALIAAAVTPAGSELVRSVRQAVGLKHAAPALTRLPTGGSLLVTSSAGPWIIQPDGSKRLLGPYAEASWSPHGLFVAVTRRHELLAVDPKGIVRWSLARTGAISLPRWAPDGYRIAYFDDSTLRIVAGDGTGDRRFATVAARVAPAWRPSGTHEHVLAFINTNHDLELVDTDSGRVLARRRLGGAPAEVLWSTDGRRLAVVAASGAVIFGRAGARLGTIRFDRPAGPAAFVPGSHHLTVILGGRRSDTVSFDLDRPRTAPTEVFSGSGRFSNLAWAPDGRWLLLAWPTADQWLFVPAGDQRVAAVAGVAAQFAPGRKGAPPPVIDGWCCLPDPVP